jgi:hypothetical protein
MVTNTTRLPAGWTTVNNERTVIRTPTTVAATNRGLDRRRKRRDRDLAAANSVIARIRRGRCALHNVGHGWFLSDDARIKPHIAEIVIPDDGVAADGDTLFPDLTHSQTYRAVLR